jgi:hypothetical protein
LDDHAHLIEVPGLAGCWTTTLNLENNGHSEFKIPLAQRFMTDADAALEEDLVHDA